MKKIIIIALAATLIHSCKAADQKKKNDPYKELKEEIIKDVETNKKDRRTLALDHEKKENEISRLRNLSFT